MKLSFLSKCRMNILWNTRWARFREFGSHMFEHPNVHNVGRSAIFGFTIYKINYSALVAGSGFDKEALICG